MSLSSHLINLFINLYLQFLGLMVYFLFGVSHSNQAIFNQSADFDEKSPGRVRFDSPPQLSTSLRNVQPENKDADSQQFLFSDSTEQTLDFPQNR